MTRPSAPIVMTEAQVVELLDGKTVKLSRSIPYRVLEKWTGKDEHLMDLVNACPWNKARWLWVKERWHATRAGCNPHYFTKAWQAGHATDREGRTFKGGWQPASQMPQMHARIVVQCRLVRIAKVNRRYFWRGLFQMFTKDWRSTRALLALAASTKVES